MKKLVTALGAAVLLHAVAALSQQATASAEIPAEEWERFKAEFAAMADRLSALEAENARLRATAASAIPVEDLNAEVALVKEQNRKSSWTETVRWKGDFRYRVEEIDRQGENSRERNRIRARAALIATPSPTIEVGLGMASGGDNPVSTNQTLGGGGSSKELRLDLAYVTWSGLENTAVSAGKFSNPFYRAGGSQLIWDSDFRPEGFAAGWRHERLFATAAYSFLESDSNAGDDVFWGVQVGATLPVLDNLSLTAAAKYLEIPSKGRFAFDADDPDFFGNSFVLVNGDPLYAVDYDLFNASLELSYSIFDWPVSTFADFVRNTAADELDTGYILGFSIGEGSVPGHWDFSYQYQDLEADGAFGLINDSNFADGSTDGKGHRLAARYHIRKSWYVAATWFDNQVGVDLGDDVGYKRLVLDTSFKY
tara:strand:+ start:20691 stop:21962 length:1272 start_codon:yes stop_codon:yes gene_type:complete